MSALPDWTPVVLNRKLTQEEALRAGQTVAVEKYKGPSNNLFKYEDPDNQVKLPQANLSLALTIKQARVSKNLSQKDLASQCNIQQKVVSDYENPSSKVVVDSQILVKMSKVLGVPLKKPKN